MRFPLAAVVGLSLACQPPAKGPDLLPSSGQSAYALKYVDGLHASAKAIADAQQQERKLTTAFGSRVDELRKADWDLVRAVIDDSDAAGKSANFFDAHDQVDNVRAFWKDEKSAVDARVIGSAQNALKQAPCTSTCADLDVGGPAASALNEAIDKQLQKRLRASNDAFVLFARAHTALGAQNTAELERLADEVAQASYLVHVDLVVRRNRLERLLDDKNAVRTTLDRFVQEEKSYQAQPGRTDAERKASEQRVAEATKSSAELDGAAAQAQGSLKAAEQVLAAAVKDYDDALRSLRDKVDQKKKAKMGKGQGLRSRTIAKHAKHSAQE
jgi:hypothetical protein